ncbi:MAG: YiiX family permuted papain-like enzyme [Flavobacteriales bacterium]
MSKFFACLVSICLFWGMLLTTSCKQEPSPNPTTITPKSPKKQIPYMEGDILFQISTSGQGKAIQLATNSPYSHCGILFRENNEWMVFEGVQPVKKTPLTEWIKRGQHNIVVSKRLKHAEHLLTASVKNRMKMEASKFIGKNYDLTFEWDDERIYCSELVYKIYQRGAGIEVGKLQKLSEFDLTYPIVKAKLVERYGKKIPLDEPVISPGAIFADTSLVEVFIQ